MPLDAIPEDSLLADVSVVIITMFQLPVIYAKQEGLLYLRTGT